MGRSTDTAPAAPGVAPLGPESALFRGLVSDADFRFLSGPASSSGSRPPGLAAFVDKSPNWYAVLVGFLVVGFRVNGFCLLRRFLSSSSSANLFASSFNLFFSAFILAFSAFSASIRSLSASASAAAFSAASRASSSASSLSLSASSAAAFSAASRWRSNSSSRARLASSSSRSLSATCASALFVGESPRV